MAKPKNSLVIYARGRRPRDDYNRVHITIHDTIEQARAWLQAFTGEEHFMVVGDTIDAEPFKLKCNHMAEIAASPVSTATVRDDYRRWILQFKYGLWEKPKDVPAPVSDGTITAVKAPKVERAKRPDGYVTITDLCAAWNVPALLGRTMLRASGRVKPEFGWAFAPNEVETIKALVMKGVTAPV